MSLTTVLLFIAAMITLGFADFATKQTAGRISPALATLIYAATATVPAGICFVSVEAEGSRGGRKKLLDAFGKGIVCERPALRRGGWSAIRAASGKLP